MLNRSKSPNIQCVALCEAVIGLLVAGCVIFIGLCHPDWQSSDLCQWSYGNGTAPACCATASCSAQLPFCPESNFAECVEFFEQPSLAANSAPHTFLFTDRLGPITLELSVLGRLRTGSMVWNVTTAGESTDTVIAFGGQQLSGNGTTQVTVKWVPGGSLLTVAYPDGPSPGFPLVVFASILSESANLWSWILEYAAGLFLFAAAISQQSYFEFKMRIFLLCLANAFLIFIVIWFPIIIPWPMIPPASQDWIAMAVPSVVTALVIQIRAGANKCYPKPSMLKNSPLVPVLIAFMGLISCVWSLGGAIAANLFGLAAVCMEALVTSPWYSTSLRAYTPLDDA